MIGKQVVAFGESEKSEFCFSLQLNQNLFSTGAMVFRKIRVT